MPNKRKPATGGQPETGLMMVTANVNVCVNTITNPYKIQLFVMFDQDTKTAVIVTGREVFA